MLVLSKYYSLVDMHMSVVYTRYSWLLVVGRLWMCVCLYVYMWSCSCVVRVLVCVCM